MACPNNQKAPFQLRDIDHVVLRVKGIDAMLHFYQSVLGATMEKQQADIGLYQLRAGNSLIDLVAVDSQLGRSGGAPPGTDGHNMDHFCLRVAPFDGPAISAWLVAQGAEPGKVQSRYGADGQGPSIYLQDPEGNVVELKGPPVPTEQTPDSAVN